MNLLEKALEDSKEIVRLRKEFEDYCCLVRDLLGLKELDAAKEALSTAVHIFTETSTLKVLAKDLAAAEEVRVRSQQSRREYKSREQATKEIELLSQLNLCWEEVRTQWEQSSEHSSQSCPHRHVENFGVESEGVEGAKFHCSGCPQKITKESHPDLFAQEKESMQRLGNQDNSTPEESAERGLTIGFILLLCEKFNLWNWTTRAVLFNFVVPMTSRLRCRFVDLPMFEQSGAEVVGLADTFISHCNKAPFGAMVAGVSDGGVNLKRKIWIDIFAVRQWPSTKHDLHFETVISKCTSFVIICPSLKEVHRGVKDLSKLSQDILAKIPFFRAWCLYEVFYAAHYEKAVVLKGGTHHLVQKNGEAAFVPNRDMLIEMSQKMNINTAETSNQSDKDMIFQKITDNFNGGVEGLNKKVKDVIVSAYETINYPVLHSAACGDEKSMAVLRGSPPDRYLENVIRGGYVALLKDIVTNDSALLEWQEPSGLTPLMIAARAGNFPCVKYLLSMGANIDAKDTVGFNALSHARDVDVKKILTPSIS